MASRKQRHHRAASWLTSSAYPVCEFSASSWLSSSSLMHAIWECYERTARQPRHYFVPHSCHNRFSDRARVTSLVGNNILSRYTASWQTALVGPYCALCADDVPAVADLFNTADDATSSTASKLSLYHVLQPYLPDQTSIGYTVPASNPFTQDKISKCRLYHPYDLQIFLLTFVWCTHWLYHTLFCCRLSIFTARCTRVQSAVLRSHVVCPSVCPSVCDVGGLWSHRLEFFENNFTVS